jgi:DNA-binding transcriptional MerR regulator
MESRDASQLIWIGEFARLGGVSIKALRLYAELGLLPPAVVRPQSRYRLYSRSQLPRLHRILLLKNAGFALAEIGGQLSHRDEATLAKIRARLLDRAEEIQRQLGWVDAELRAAARVVVKRVPKLEVWSQRQWIDSYDQADVLLEELGGQVPEPARLVSGAIWHDCGQRSGRIDCEVFWVFHRVVRGEASNEFGPVTVASILHEGDESAIGSSYEAVDRWIRENRFHVAGPKREIYLGGSLTEIQIPIGK